MLELLRYLGYRLKATKRADLDFILENECDAYADDIDDEGNGVAIMYYGDASIYFYFKKYKLVDVRPFYKPFETITIMPHGDNMLIGGSDPANDYLNEFNNVDYMNSDIELILMDDLVKASISYYAIGLDIYADNADLLARANEKYRSEYEPMPAVNGFNDVFIVGKIKEVERIRNEYTGLYYYVCSVKIAKRLITILFDDSEENKSLKKGAILRGEVRGYGRVVPLFEGFSEFFGYGIHNSEFPNIKNILDLYNACYSAYSLATTYSGSRDSYSLKYRTLGQCCITALLVQELTGAEIYRYDDGELEHFFNRLNDEVLDLASEFYSFNYGGLDYSLSKPFNKNTIKASSFYKRYELFKNRVKEYKPIYFSVDNTSFSSIGFYMNRRAVAKSFSNILDYKHDNEMCPYEKNGEYNLLCDINNKAQVWYYISNDVITDVIPFYESGNMLEVRNVRRHKDSEGRIDKRILDFEGLEGFPFRAFNISLKWMNKFKRNKSYRCELSLIAERVALYNDNEELEANEGAIAEISIFPPSAMDLRDDDNNIRYLIAGEIKSLNRLLNKRTNNYYYEILLNNYIGDLMVVVGENKLASEPRVGAILLGEYEGTARLCELFVGYDEFKDLVIEKSTNRHLKTILDLYRVLYEAYSLDTCFYYSREWWSKSNRTIGQCCLVAMLVHDLIGADMYIIRDDERGQHYYNMLDGKILDLTSEQYEAFGTKFDYSKGVKIERASIKSENCIKRYNKLIDNMREYLQKIDENAS